MAHVDQGKNRNRVRFSQPRLMSTGGEVDMDSFNVAPIEQALEYSHQISSIASAQGSNDQSAILETLSRHINDLSLEIKTLKQERGHEPNNLCDPISYTPAKPQPQVGKYSNYDPFDPICSTPAYQQVGKSEIEYDFFGMNDESHGLSEPLLPLSTIQTPHKQYSFPKNNLLVDLPLPPTFEPSGKQENYPPTPVTPPPIARFSSQRSHKVPYYDVDSLPDTPSKHMRLPNDFTTGLPTYQSYQNFPHRKIQKPAIFDGKSVEWIDYKEHFKAVAIYNRWDISEMGQQLQLQLRGPAQKVLRELPVHLKRDYHTLYEALQNRFDPPERKLTHKVSFRSRVKLPQESAAEFGQDLRDLGGKAFPSMSAEDKEELLLDQFQQGLKGDDRL